MRLLSKVTDSFENFWNAGTRMHAKLQHISFINQYTVAIYTSNTLQSFKKLTKPKRKQNL